MMRRGPSLEMNKMEADARLSMKYEREWTYNEIFHHPASAFSKEQNVFPHFSPSRRMRGIKADALQRRKKCKQSHCARDGSFHLETNDIVHSEKLSEIEMKIWFSKRNQKHRERVKVKEQKWKRRMLILVMHEVEMELSCFHRSFDVIVWAETLL